MQETLEYIKQAFELKKQGFYKQAIEMLYKALEEQSDNVEIFYQLGELYYLLKNFQRAEHYIEKVLSADENHTDALKILEQIYEYTDISRAFQAAQKIYDLQSDKNNLLKLIGVMSKKGDTNKLKQYENSQDDEILYAISKAYYDNKFMQDAKNVLDRLLAINPNNTDAQILLGKIYFDGSEFEKSRQIFEKFSNNIDNAEVLNYLGLFATEDMKFIDAIKCFSKASNLDKANPKYFYNLANAYFYNGWIKEAVSSYLQAICLAPENLGYRYSLAYLYYEIKNFDKAQREVDYILETDAEYAQAHVLNALLKFAGKDYIGAQTELETLLKNGHDDNFTLISLADVYIELKMFEKAQKLIEKTIERNPESLNYKCKLSNLMIEQKKFDDALHIVEDILKTNENYIKAYITGAKAAYIKGDIDRSKEFAQSAISLDMNYAEGYYYLALVRFKEGDFAESTECMKRAIVYDVDNPIYYSFMSNILEAQKDYSGALEYMKEAESISGDTLYRSEVKRLSGLKKKTK